MNIDKIIEKISRWNYYVEVWLYENWSVGTAYPYSYEQWFEMRNRK